MDSARRSTGSARAASRGRTPSPRSSVSTRRSSGAGLCITGEGAVDRQSARGKTVAAVARACARAGVPCVVLGGRVDAEGAELLAQLGARVHALGPPERPLAEALRAAAADLERLAQELAA